MLNIKSTIFLLLAVFTAPGFCNRKCKKCLRQGKVFTPTGCQDSCLMDTWCYTDFCPKLQDIDECNVCHAFGGDFSPEAGCNKRCPMDVSCYKNDKDECPPPLSPFPSSCEQCLQQGKVFTPEGCQDLCLMDTWCYTDSCPQIESIETCSMCLAFGGYFKIGQGCVLESCEAMDSSCYSSETGCPDLSGISTCKECVENGGYFTGDSPACVASCLFFLPCITDCSFQP